MNDKELKSLEYLIRNHPYLHNFNFKRFENRFFFEVNNCKDSIEYLIFHYNNDGFFISEINCSLNECLKILTTLIDIEQLIGIEKA